jgi:ribosome-associated heat shock protein Hsp15
VRTRTDAAKLVGSGLVRLNGNRIAAASQAVRSGDVLTVALDRTVRVLRAKGFSERRGGPDSVEVLYEDLTPPPPPREDRAPVAGVREPGAGRPTKRDRRALDRLMEGATGWKEP